MKKPKIAVIRFGMGNIFSVIKALESRGAEVVLTDEGEAIEKCDALVIPGDGAFGAAMENLRQRNLLHVINKHIEKNKWLFGICVGFQILFSESEEFGHHKGIGIWPGKISQFHGNFKIPHIGWNQVKLLGKQHPVFHNIADNANFYFIHSFFAPPSLPVTVGECDYFGSFTAIAASGKVIGTQFHPEKSHSFGMKIIENFCTTVRSEL